jgi:hypothetical protein
MLIIATEKFFFTIAKKIIFLNTNQVSSHNKNIGLLTFNKKTRRENLGLDG